MIAAACSHVYLHLWLTIGPAGRHEGYKRCTTKQRKRKKRNFVQHKTSAALEKGLAQKYYCLHMRTDTAAASGFSTRSMPEKMQQKNTAKKICLEGRNCTSSPYESASAQYAKSRSILLILNLAALISPSSYTAARRPPAFTRGA